MSCSPCWTKNWSHRARDPRHPPCRAPGTASANGAGSGPFYVGREGPSNDAFRTVRVLTGRQQGLRTSPGPRPRHGEGDLPRVGDEEGPLLETSRSGRPERHTSVSSPREHREPASSDHVVAGVLDVGLPQRRQYGAGAVDIAVVLLERDPHRRGDRLALDLAARVAAGQLEVAVGEHPLGDTGNGLDRHHDYLRGGGAGSFSSMYPVSRTGARRTMGSAPELRLGFTHPYRAAGRGRATPSPGLDDWPARPRAGVQVEVPAGEHLHAHRRCVGAPGVRLGEAPSPGRRRPPAPGSGTPARPPARGWYVSTAV